MLQLIKIICKLGSSMSLDPAIRLIKKYEGLKLRPYICAGGKNTIGYGHVIRPNENFHHINEDQAHNLLVRDIRDAEEAMIRFVKVPLNNNQRCALISFIFNLGPGNFQRSTLLEVVNQAKHLDAPEQFIRWTFAGGRRLLGLMRRRVEEAMLYVS
jgi:lysozyme